MKVYVGMAPGYTDESHVFPFAKSLLTYFDRSGVAYTDRVGTGEDVALCVQWVPGYDVVEELRRRGVVIVHRLDGRARALVKSYDRDDENRRINGVADWTVFQSGYVREHTTGTCETIFGNEPPVCATPERGSVIYNGVDRSVFREDGPAETLDGEFRILHVAFTHGIRKCVGELVRLAELLCNNPKIRFYTVGRQDQDMAHGHLLRGLPNVHHLGVIIDRERLARIMRACHVLFFPSRNDYCPNTVLEAMSCGLPIWYHNSGGTPELVRTDELVAGVPMMDGNPIYPLHVLREHREEFSRRAVEMVERRFTVEHMGRAYTELFRRLLAERDTMAAGRERSGMSTPGAVG